MSNKIEKKETFDVAITIKLTKKQEQDIDKGKEKHGVNRQVYIRHAINKQIEKDKDE